VKLHVPGDLTRNFRLYVPCDVSRSLHVPGGVTRSFCLHFPGDVTRSFRLHVKSSSLNMRSTIAFVKKHAEMSVKNDVVAVSNRLAL